MKGKLKRSISVILTVMMVFTAMPVFAWAETGSSDVKVEQVSVTAQGVVTPSMVNEAVTKFTDALSKFCADTSELSEVSGFLTRFGGVTAAASGVIGILQMSGIIKDPTKEMLGQILNTMHDIQDQLDQMDKKLDNINQQLVSLAVKQEEKDRNNKATTMLKYWRDFNTTYSEPLDDRINEYQGMINRGVRDWWKQPHGGVRLLYTEVSQWDYSLTFSRNSYEEGIPAKADNGEVIAATECIGIPAEWVPDTTRMTFNVNSYQNDFETKLAENIMEAADQKKLDADEEFYQLWDKSTQKGREEMAATYAHDAMNTLLYQIACDVMSDNDDWVIKVTNAYKNYCNNVLKQDSGVNAMLNAMYLTHGFEGEIKQDVRDFCDQMAAQAGVYGQFALTCAGQDSLQTLARKQELQTLFTNTVINLYDKKEKALTGYDNYCYITGTRIEHEVIHADATTTLKQHNGGYRGYSSTDWTIEVPSILDGVYATVLYDQYKALNQGKKSFSSYLKAYGAFPSDNWNGKIMTRYVGQRDFSMSEGIHMKCTFRSGGDYFRQEQFYYINKWNSSDVENQYFHVHNKLVCDYFLMGNGTLEVDHTAAARALYGEAHWNWTNDEMGIFETNGCIYRANYTGDSETEFSRLKINVLKLTPVHDLNGDVDPEDPFFSFDKASLTPGISDQVGPTYRDPKTPITGLALESGAYPYTGKAVKPKVTVKAGKKTLPAGSYKVTYSGNRAIGTAAVTVKGKGKYAGTISQTFNIVPKGTRIKKIKRQKTTATLKWKKQKAKMPKARITGYQIRYSTTSSMKNAKKVTVKGYKRTSKKIKGLKKNKKYYFQVRTYVKTKKGNIYSRWSSRKSVRGKS